jgi:Leucine-rich repeat (LRR) protein
MLLPDCSQYENDDQVEKSFPFSVDFKSLKTSKTSGMKNANGNIIYLNIANEEYVPSSVFCMKDLQNLYVRNTMFPNLYLGIGIERLARSLTHLTIHDTIVAHLPEQIGKLKRLQWLELSNTSLMTLPNSIGDLSSLTNLILPNNNLTSLPITITNTHSLRILKLNDNPHLRSIQSINRNSNLKVLRTDNCPIEHIPVNLPLLTDLHMSNNSLTDLFGIQTLGDKANGRKSFYFDGNSILHLSPQIRQVKEIDILNLDHNKLYSLPLDIFILTKLQSLYIRNNYFSGKDLQEIVSRFNTTYPNSKIFY